MADAPSTLCHFANKIRIPQINRPLKRHLIVSSIMTTTFHFTKDNAASFCPPYCRIKSRHILEMYYRYDSGICDQTTANAVALALSEKTRERVRVYHIGRQWFARIGERTCELPPAVGKWLDRVDRGLNVAPFTLHFGGGSVPVSRKTKLAA